MGSDEWTNDLIKAKQFKNKKSLDSILHQTQLGINKETGIIELQPLIALSKPVKIVISIKEE